VFPNKGWKDIVKNIHWCSKSQNKSLGESKQIFPSLLSWTANPWGKKYTRSLILQCCHSIGFALQQGETGLGLYDYIAFSRCHCHGQNDAFIILNYFRDRKGHIRYSNILFNHLKLFFKLNHVI